MAQIPINVGVAANDGSGDPLRTAFQAIGANFTELYALQSQTVNAGAADLQRASKELTVQAAIDNAGVLGKPRVFIPDTIFPYDASLVTFNNAIQLVREGGAWNVYDVDAYGAGDPLKLDESASVQAAFNGLPAAGGVIEMGPKTYRAKNITPPLAASYVVRGAGTSATIVRPPAASPTNPVFDLSNSNGPGKYFAGFTLAGGNVGSFQSTGIKLSTTNGLRLRDMWFVGCLTGIDWFTPSSDMDVQGCTFESCGIGVNFRGDPIAVNMRGTGYFDNQQDLQISGDCAKFLHTNSASYRCTNTAVYVNACTNFSMTDFKIFQAVNGINVTGSPESSFADGLFSGCTNDFVNSGTLRIYTRDVQGNHAPFYGAGLYAGTFNGGKRRMITTGMPNSLAWNQGDEAEERLQVAGTPVRWHRLTTGSAHVLNTDWKAGPNL